MKKRVLIVVLWFYVTWCAVALVAGTVGYDPRLGSIAGAIVAAALAVAMRRQSIAKPATEQRASSHAQLGEPATHQTN